LRWRVRLGTDDCGRGVFRNLSGSSFEFEPAHFRGWAGDNMAGWVTSKVRGNFGWAVLDCKSYFRRPQYGHWNASDFLPREKSLELRNYAG
jgi:hypothetical protein